MPITPELWEGDGLEDTEFALSAISNLELFEDELKALHEYCKEQGYIWEKVAKYSEHEERERTLMVSRFFWRRAQRWKELLVEIEKRNEEKQ